MKTLFIVGVLLALAGCVEWAPSGTIVYERATCDKLVVITEDSWFELLTVEDKKGNASVMTAGEVVLDKADCVNWRKP